MEHDRRALILLTARSTWIFSHQELTYLGVSLFEFPGQGGGQNAELGLGRVVENAV